VQNTARQGVPIPVIYGEVITGSVVISAGVDITQIQK
jgi:predicted phage tail protein